MTTKDAKHTNGEGLKEELGKKWEHLSTLISTDQNRTGIGGERWGMTTKDSKHTNGEGVKES